MSVERTPLACRLAGAAALAVAFLSRGQASAQTMPGMAMPGMAMPPTDPGAPQAQPSPRPPDAMAMGGMNMGSMRGDLAAYPATATRPAPPGNRTPRP